MAPAVFCVKAQAACCWLISAAHICCQQVHYCRLEWDLVCPCKCTLCREAVQRLNHTAEWTTVFLQLQCEQNVLIWTQGGRTEFTDSEHIYCNADIFPLGINKNWPWCPLKLKLMIYFLALAVDFFSVSSCFRAAPQRSPEPGIHWCGVQAEGSRKQDSIAPGVAHRAAANCPELNDCVPSPTSLTNPMPACDHLITRFPVPPSLCAKVPRHVNCQPDPQSCLHPWPSAPPSSTRVTLMWGSLQATHLSIF